MIEELIEAGVELDQVDVRMIDLLKGEQFETDFTDRNLNQKIPTLRHDGLDIIESCAILQYLGETFPTPLLPLDQKKWDVLPGCTGRLLMSVQFSAINSVIPATWQMCPMSKKSILWSDLAPKR